MTVRAGERSNRMRGKGFWLDERPTWKSPDPGGIRAPAHKGARRSVEGEPARGAGRGGTGDVG